MRQVPSWDAYHYGQAVQAAERSKDPDTQVGCVIVNDDHHVISTGYNGFPPGVDETAEMWASGVKHDRVIHAEMNAIAAAAKNGHSLKGCTLYVTYAPCMCRGCSQLIISAGIRRVVHGPVIWHDDYAKARQLFHEAGVEVDKP